MMYFPVYECPNCGARFGTDDEAKKHAEVCLPNTWPWGDPLEIRIKEPPAL